MFLWCKGINIHQRTKQESLAGKIKIKISKYFHSTHLYPSLSTSEKVWAFAEARNEASPLAEGAVRLNCWRRFHNSLKRRRSFGYSPSKACLINVEAVLSKIRIFNFFIWFDLKWFNKIKFIFAASRLNYVICTNIKILKYIRDIDIKSKKNKQIVNMRIKLRKYTKAAE